MEQFRPAHVIAEDTALASAFRDGGDAAIRTLYDRFGGRVFTVANQGVGDRQRADDVTQHTFLQAWRNAEQFEPGRDFASWLATLTRRAAALSAPSLSAEQVESVWVVRTAIESLDDEERAVAKLQHIDGRTDGQIAAQLGIAVGTVTSCSQRAQRRLTKHSNGEISALLAESTMWDEPGADLGDRIVNAIRSESDLDDAAPVPANATDANGGRRRGWLRPALLGAAAAVVFLFGGIVVLSALSGVDDRERFSSELTSTGVLANVSGEVDITVFESGLRIDLDAPTLPRRDGGTFYEAWLTTVDGDLIAVGTFNGGDGVVLWSGVGLDQVEAFTITEGSADEIVLRTLVSRN